MATNRERSVRAAIELVGTQGIRALTHSRVDRAAGLPPGSTSNSFRTRAALVQAVALGMLEAEEPEIESLRTTAARDGLAEALSGLFEFMVGPNRTMTAARLTLLIEAGHDADVRAALTEGRRRVTASLLPLLAELGVPDPALAVEVFATTFEGLYLHRIAGHAEIDSRAVLEATTRAVAPGS